jgi:hypothetical protein
MKRLLVRLVGTLAIPFAMTGASELAAQEQFFPELTLKRSYVKTNNLALFVDGSPSVDVFTPTTVTCAPGGSCAVRVEVSASMGTAANFDGFAASVYVDGDAAAPAHHVRMSSGEYITAHTFAWTVAGLNAGSHIVEVKFNLADGTSGYIGSRSLTIQVFKN